jgi:ABC-2 type transport system permease protein
VFGVRPPTDNLGTLALIVSLGALCCSAVGLAVSTLVPSPAAITPFANGTSFPLLLLAGVFFPLPPLPSWLHTALGALPVQPLTNLLTATFSHAALSIGAIGILAAWTVGGAVAAMYRFRWSDTT